MKKFKLKENKKLVVLVNRVKKLPVSAKIGLAISVALALAGAVAMITVNLVNDGAARAELSDSASQASRLRDGSKKAGGAATTDENKSNSSNKNSKLSDKASTPGSPPSLVGGSTTGSIGFTLSPSSLTLNLDKGCEHISVKPVTGTPIKYYNATKYDDGGSFDPFMSSSALVEFSNTSASIMICSGFGLPGGTHTLKIGAYDEDNLYRAYGSLTVKVMPSFSVEQRMPAPTLAKQLDGTTLSFIEKYSGSHPEGIGYTFTNKTDCNFTFTRNSDTTEGGFTIANFWVYSTTGGCSPGQHTGVVRAQGGLGAYKDLTFRVYIP